MKMLLIILIFTLLIFVYVFYFEYISVPNHSFQQPNDYFKSFHHLEYSSPIIIVIIIGAMFKSKLQYLQQQNIHLRRQNALLHNISQHISQDNQKSLIFQLRQQNQQLYLKLQQLSDELLLEKTTREVEKSLHQENIEDFNQVIFALKEQIKKLEGIIKEEGKVQQELGVVQKWFRGKINAQKDEVFHKYADPILFFNILQEILQSMNIGKPTQQSIELTCEQLDNHSKNSEVYFKQQIQQIKEAKWFEDQSQIYFIKKKRKQNLHIKLKHAKMIQFAQNRIKFKNSKSQPLNNIKLLKESYVNLIGEFQKQKKRLSLYQKYIQELQNRNRLLIASHTAS